MFSIPVANVGLWTEHIFHRKLFSTNTTVLLLQSIPYCETNSLSITDHPPPCPWHRFMVQQHPAPFSTAFPILYLYLLWTLHGDRDYRDHSPAISVYCRLGQAKLHDLSFILLPPFCTEQDCRIMEGWTPPVWQGTAAGAVPCSSSSLAPGKGQAEAELNVHTEDRYICFSCFNKALQTKLWSLYSASSYLVLPARSWLNCTAASM